MNGARGERRDPLGAKSHSLHGFRDPRCSDDASSASGSRAEGHFADQSNGWLAFRSLVVIDSTYGRSTSAPRSRSHGIGKEHRRSDLSEGQARRPIR
jgi:hypothetical protein